MDKTRSRRTSSFILLDRRSGYEQRQRAMHGAKMLTPLRFFFHEKSPCTIRKAPAIPLRSHKRPSRIFCLLSKESQSQTSPTSYESVKGKPSSILKPSRGHIRPRLLHRVVDNLMFRSLLSSLGQSPGAFARPTKCAHRCEQGSVLYCQLTCP